MAAGITSLVACNESNLELTLPNGSAVTARNNDGYSDSVQESEKYPGSKTFVPREKTLCTTLSEISRAQGIVEYIGPVLPNDDQTDIVNQLAIAGQGIIAGGDASNTYVNEKGIVIKVGDESGLKLLYVKPSKENMPAGVLYGIVKEGDTISFPTVRKFEFPDCRFRTLRDIDHYFVDEIRLEPQRPVENASGQ